MPPPLPKGRILTSSHKTGLKGLLLIRNSSSHISEWGPLTSPQRSRTGIYLLYPIWEILPPSSDLLMAPYAPSQLGLLVSPIPTEETFVSWLERRGRLFRPCKALRVLPLSMEGTVWDLGRRKLRYKVTKQLGPTELQMLSFSLSPLPHTCPLPSLRPG